MPVSEYLTALANRELYSIHPRAVGGYLGIEGRWIRRGEELGLEGFKRIRLLTGPGKGCESLFEERDLQGL